MNKKKYIKSLSGIAIGALLGFGYYTYIGCHSGSCAITSDPLNSTAYGAVMGLVLMWPSKETVKNKPSKEEDTDHA